MSGSVPERRVICRARMEPCVLTHGGAGNSKDVTDGCERACGAALGALRSGGSALDAAIAAVVILEDDPRMNAGTGSTLRLDGQAQMDAGVMDAHNFGAVAVVEGITNPVKLARHVYSSPHLLIAGAGANELAARIGLERSDPVTDRQRARLAERMAHLDEEPSYRRLYGGVDPRFRGADASDTVGAVVRAADGSFAAASSTGGIWCAIRGRVGDTPIPGAGLWVGPHGAVAATGTGEFIWKEMLSVRVHDAMANGAAAQRAVDEAVAAFRAKHPGIDCGLIAVDARGSGCAATTQMPWAAA